MKDSNVYLPTVQQESYAAKCKRLAKEKRIILDAELDEHVTKTIRYILDIVLKMAKEEGIFETSFKWLPKELESNIGMGGGEYIRYPKNGKEAHLMLERLEKRLQEPDLGFIVKREENAAGRGNKCLTIKWG